ncbi:MAG: hypothetical protein RDU14_00580 [Melioribacteraceae bacterium]|nr:hypothetical protein [Melioribacteraceae bacterium]
MKSTTLFFIISLISLSTLTAQVDSTAYGNVEIFVIDSYITSEQPYKFSLSFFTSDSTISKVFILDDKEYSVSEKFTDNHKFEIVIKESFYDTQAIKYFLFVIDKNGEKSKSQLYEVEIPKTIIVENQKDSGLLQICCFGGVIFGLPSPTIVFKSNKQFFSLTKEIPIFSFYSGGYNYPFGYIGAEYAYIFNSDKKNFLRLGYKQIIQLKFVEYVSAGLNFFSDFKGYNGISPELSLGLLRIQNVFTLYSRYRYNFQFGKDGTGFHEFSIGLFSNFFSLNL